MASTDPNPITWNQLRPHAVCVPFPAQGHINPMLKLAKLLHHRGFHITFVNTVFNHNRLLKSRGLHSLNALPSFRFEAIPDGLPPSHPDSTQDVAAIFNSISTHLLNPFTRLLSNLHPQVTCIVSDFAMNFTLDAAKQFSNVPVALLWTASACGLMCYEHYHNIIQRGFTPLKDESYLTNGYLNTVLDWIPTMEGIRLKDMPMFVRTTDPDDVKLNFSVKKMEKAREASAIILNTFDELEPELIHELASILPPVYTIGPLHLLVDDQIPDNALSSIGSNLWKEEAECLEWLDSKQPNSVLYVNFGSITVMTTQQLTEFALGLANSKQNFLWIIRPDLVVGESSVFTPEFAEQTKERGLLAGWCPQEQVLSHPSIAGFLTHSGWNSTLESISNGVPMVCWPFFAEQQTNCWHSCNKWGVGMEMEMESDVTRDEVERVVLELMEKDKGKELKRKAMELRKMAKDAIHNSNGSSYLNLDKVINQVLHSTN